jgi:hypothetical protein
LLVKAFHSVVLGTCVKYNFIRFFDLISIYEPIIRITHMHVYIRYTYCIYLNQYTLTCPAVFNCVLCCCAVLPGRRGVTLGKPDIKVETINKETHSLEEDSGSVSTASRMVKAMYSVSCHDNGTAGCLELSYLWFMLPKFPLRGSIKFTQSFQRCLNSEALTLHNQPLRRNAQIIFTSQLYQLLQFYLFNHNTHIFNTYDDPFSTLI